MVLVTYNIGSCIEMGILVYEPPRDGPTLWEIGIPDRSAAEFYVPDPDPKYINRLFVNHPDRLVSCHIYKELFVYLFSFNSNYKLVSSAIFLCLVYYTMKLSNLEHLILLAGFGSTDYGTDIQNCITMKIWFTQLVLVTTAKIGSSHRFPGLFL